MAKTVLAGCCLPEFFAANTWADDKSFHLSANRCTWRFEIEWYRFEAKTICCYDVANTTFQAHRFWRGNRDEAPEWKHKINIEIMRAWWELWACGPHHFHLIKFTANASISSLGVHYLARRSVQVFAFSLSVNLWIVRCSRRVPENLYLIIRSAFKQSSNDYVPHPLFVYH